MDMNAGSVTSPLLITSPETGSIITANAVESNAKAAPGVSARSAATAKSRGTAAAADRFSFKIKEVREFTKTGGGRRRY
jgi:hypothetical protein